MSGVVVSIPRSGFHLYERLVVRYLLASGTIDEYLGHFPCDEDGIKQAVELIRASAGNASFILNSHLGSRAGYVGEAEIAGALAELANESKAFAFTKTHDSTGAFPATSSMNLVVLIRDPFHQLLSIFWNANIAPKLSTHTGANDLQSGIDLPDAGVFEQFLKRHLPEYGKFFCKWIESPIIGRRIIPYESTILEPVESTCRMIEWIFPEIAVDRQLVENLCASAEPENRNSGGSTFVSESALAGVRVSERASMLSVAYQGVIPDCRPELERALAIKPNTEATEEFNLGRFYFDNLMDPSRVQSVLNLPKGTIIS